MSGPEMWGGAECTVVRVGDRWSDQSHLSGHHGRDDDLDLFAALGFTAMRYPVLWERVAPGDPDGCDWRWTDRRLHRLCELGIRPIAGLVHHGSGPHHTNLLDPEFPAKLGRYAGQVAARYPWIRDWTPVNEPLTTARFAGLYGHWYPHAHDERSFWTALVNQVDGVAHAMRAIRAVVPDARLIGTDDLGRTYATAPLFHQAAFDNARRWAGWDLLFGRMVPGHPLWSRLADFGLADRLASLAADPCPPDVVGVNHYLTSDRFLDHRIQRYPADVIGGNYEQRYADVEAVRVLDPAPAGLAGALREAWDRYGKPVAITEVHLGCTREEQLRWAAEAWDTAVALRAEGVDVLASTAWAVLGSCGWNTLLTADGVYEPGLYDVSAGTPRPTALAPLWRGLPTAAERHPVARAPGWWRRPTRFAHPPVPRPARFERAAPALPEPEDAPPLLIVGAGPLARAFARHCALRQIRHATAERGPALPEVSPWAVVDARDWPAAGDPAACRRAGAEATALARAAAALGVPMLGFTGPAVFDGAADRAYVEGDAPAPRDALGRAQAAFERAALAPGGRHLLVRAGLPFEPDDDGNPAAALAVALEAGRRVAMPANGAVTPAYVPTLVDAALDLLIDGADGVWHLAHPESLTPAAFARAVAGACGLDASLIDEVPAPPVDAALASARGRPLPPLADALARFAEVWAHRRAPVERRAA